MAAPKIGSKYVPSQGPLNAKLMIVGEAPGVEEEQKKQPFVGKSGQFLERYLGRLGIRRSDVLLTNLCKYRPLSNKFENLLGSDALKEGLSELDEEIATVKPNLILAVGNWPMYYLTGMTASKGTPGTGIMNWRGSVVEGSSAHIPSAGGRKTLITFHPAFIVRPNGFGWHPIFFNDLMKIKREILSPELSVHPYVAHIDPVNMDDLAKEMGESEWLTVDIETFGDSLACVGFADSINRGMCITFESVYGWDYARALLASKAKKIFQFGTFDINYLKHFMNWDTENYAFDTYIATANLLPEFPRGLDFLTSIHTPMPFYKEERKSWKNTGSLTSLWNYNIKDVIATHWIAMEQMKELRELYG